MNRTNKSRTSMNKSMKKNKFLEINVDDIESDSISNQSQSLSDKSQTNEDKINPLDDLVQGKTNSPA